MSINIIACGSCGHAEPDRGQSGLCPECGGFMNVGCTGYSICECSSCGRRYIPRWPYTWGTVECPYCGEENWPNGMIDSL